MGTGFDVDIEEHQVGIIPRAIQYLFDGIKKLTNQAQEVGEAAPQFKISAQFLELYNEEVIDLFDTSQDYSLTKVKMKLYNVIGICYSVYRIFLLISILYRYVYRIITHRQHTKHI